MSASLRRRASRASWFQLSLTALLIGPLALPSHAAAPSFADLSIEELMNVSITSVSRKPTTLGHAPAAVTVLSPDEIHRSGHTLLPEMLRLVPGMSVARIHGNEWAVSARGFNNQYANKLLVLVDGRTVYSPMFAGVYWNSQDAMPDDLERIEVIRGPGASVWGANAVNGVINVSSKSARDTQGGVVNTSFGTLDRLSARVRYGGQLGDNAYYRVYASQLDRTGFATPPGSESPDDWKVSRVGARVDWEPVGTDTFTLQGEYYRGSFGEQFDGVSLEPPFTTHQALVHDNFGGNLLGRWTRDFSSTSAFTIQTYFDRFHQWDGDIAETRNTFDLDLSHRFSPRPSHDLVWGLGYRYTTDRLLPSFYLSFTPERDTAQLFSAFVQDEMTLVPDVLKLIAGAKVERHEYVGFEVQPNASLLWTPARHVAIWASASRAARTPSRYDRHSRINAAAFQPESSPPMLIGLFGTPDATSEMLTAYEAGFRLETSRRVTLDVATFYNTYDHLLTFVSGQAVFEATPAPAHLLLPSNYINANAGHTFGTEVSVEWQPFDFWKLTASHTWLQMKLSPDPTAETESPRHQFQLHSHLDLTRQLQLNAAAYYVGRVMSPLDNEQSPIDAHLRIDLGVTWRPNDALELSVWGQNLGDARHAEFGSFKTNQLAEIPRSFSAQLKWRF